MITAIVNSTGVVVDAIKGDVTGEHAAAFQEHYRARHGQVQLVAVDPDVTKVWIEGKYIDGEFYPPEPEYPSDEI